MEFTILHYAAGKGYVNIIKMFKDVLQFQEINPLDKSGLYTPMLLASQFGKIEVVRYYIQNESEEVWNRASNSTDIFDNGIKPLHRAAKYGRNSVLKELLAHVNDTMPRNAVGETPLHYSAKYGRVKATEILLNSTDNSSLFNSHAFKEDGYWTPLHHAATNGKKSVVQLLLRKIVGNKNPKNKPGFKVRLSNIRLFHMPQSNACYLASLHRS